MGPKDLERMASLRTEELRLFISALVASVH